jgi:hypothetical protein
MTLQLVHAVVVFAALLDWGLRPPPLAAPAVGHPAPLTRRLANWKALRETLLVSGIVSGPWSNPS